MADVFEVTIWARGVTQDMEGRHLSLVIANAASKGGKHTQAWDNYADLPDRVQVPLRKYCRISDAEIEMRYLYENDHPELVFVMDDTIVKGIDILRGMKKGGTLVVNSKRSADELLALIPNKDLLKAFVTVDASGIIGGTGLDSVDFMGSEGGTEAVAVAVGLAAPMIGAATKICDKFSLAHAVECASNKGAVKEGAKTAVVKSL
ncbi:MAG: 2-oxoacid:acceptor oxidoreductase family protein [Deltaproteobacteria bacterium]|nr:2-oxoacid:acceptor oxidoreductase family protein [Deltaproteobacteria bacterium]